jgi:2-polyprenyl-3-methyl-5-hydroxy-6-metoxy-1,4-benzoquinol methylase/predicted kinase
LNQASWTEARVRELLATNAFTYQNVSLPYGLSTGGKDRSKTARAIFPDAMPGRSVFDVGCMYGFFCFDAEDRGATHCTGADIDPENVRKCRLLAECRGSAAEFIHFDIENEEIDGQFDYVLCLNVLHHLRNPIGVLEKLIRATRERLVLEIASFGPNDRKKNGVSMFAAAFLRHLPVMYVAGRANGGTNSSQTFFITEAAIMTLLAGHRASFAKIEIIGTGHKGRYIAIGHKRRIGHLVVVAGLQASGKSTLIENIKAKTDSVVAERIGIDQSQNWSVQHFGSLSENEDAEHPNLILHYNISKHLIDGDLYHHSRALSDVMATAEKVTIVTVWCPRERLLQQFQEGRTGNRKKSVLSRRHRKKIRHLTELYDSDTAFQAMFDEWIAFVKARPDPNFVVEYDDVYRVSTTSEWKPAAR